LSQKYLDLGAALLVEELEEEFLVRASVGVGLEAEDSGDEGRDGQLGWEVGDQAPGSLEVAEAVGDLEEGVELVAARAFAGLLSRLSIEVLRPALRKPARRKGGERITFLMPLLFRSSRLFSGRPSFEDLSTSTGRQNTAKSKGCGSSFRTRIECFLRSLPCSRPSISSHLFRTSTLDTSPPGIS